MIKINDILGLINDGLKTHYFKDITTYKVAELVTRKDIEDKDYTRPAIYSGDGNYTFIQDDTSGLNIYHRILSLENEEDLDSGFGRNSLTTENYKIRTVFFGQQIAIEQSCEDINYYLAKEFKKLIPRRLDIADTNRISITNINYVKNSIKKDEYVEFSPDSVLFTIDLDIVIKGIEECNELKCS